MGASATVVTCLLSLTVCVDPSSHSPPLSPSGAEPCPARPVSLPCALLSPLLLQQLRSGQRRDGQAQGAAGGQAEGCARGIRWQEVCEAVRDRGHADGQAARRRSQRAGGKGELRPAAAAAAAAAAPLPGLRFTSTLCHLPLLAPALAGQAPARSRRVRWLPPCQPHGGANPARLARRRRRAAARGPACRRSDAPAASPRRARHAVRGDRGAALPAHAAGGAECGGAWAGEPLPALRHFAACNVSVHSLPACLLFGPTNAWSLRSGMFASSKLCASLFLEHRPAVGAAVLPTYSSHPAAAAPLLCPPAGRGRGQGRRRAGKPAHQVQAGGGGGQNGGAARQQGQEGRRVVVLSSSAPDSASSAGPPCQGLRTSVATPTQIYGTLRLTPPPLCPLPSSTLQARAARRLGRARQAATAATASRPRRARRARGRNWHQLILSSRSVGCGRRSLLLARWLSGSRAAAAAEPRCSAAAAAPSPCIL